VNRLEYSNDDYASVLDKHGLASVTLSAGWSDGRAAHEEQLHMEKFSVWPRSRNDPHADKTPYSCPVYAVWGCKPE